MITPPAGVDRHDGLRIPVGGETVAASRLTPTDRAEPLPALLVYTPYRKDDRAYGLHYPGFHYFAERGYEVVLADMVGTGASTGAKPVPFAPAEGNEAAAVVEWLADRDWTTGRVGMFGLSYPGVVALAAAARRPDGLGAIVPIHGPPIDYRDMYEGGAFELFRMGGHWLPLMGALAALPPSRRDPGGRWADVWETRLEDLRDREPWLFQYLRHESRDDYWREKEIPVGRIRTPTLAVGGYRDEANTASVVDGFERIEAPKRLLLGPWRHTMPTEGRETTVDFYRQMREWFDHFLKDEDNDAEAGPTIAYWTERNGGGHVGEGVWRGTDRWPDDGSHSAVAFALSPAGLVPPGEHAERLERSYEYDQTVGMYSVDYGRPLDTSADDARSLVFETPPLDTPVELTGTGAVDLCVRATTPDLVLAARLVDVAPDGGARLVTGGRLAASHRESLSDPVPLSTDEERITVSLAPKSHVFETGHRLRLAVSGADFPRVLPRPENGTLAVLSTPEDPSVLRVPGERHPGGAEFDDTTAMSRFENDAYAEPDRPGGGWESSRDHLEDTATVRATEGYDVSVPHGEFEFAGEHEASVAAGDPGTVRLSRETAVSFDWGTEAVHVEASNRVSRDTVQAHTRVTLDGHVVFDETWRMRP